MRFYLDNNLISDEPNGNITTTIKRDSQLGGFLITNDAKLKWEGDGYDYIQSAIDLEGFCGEIDCRIDDECNGETVNIFIGKIFILEIEKNSNCIITAPLQDNSFHARINKNRSIEINIDTTRSKNGTTIEAAKESRITMFAPPTGAALIDTRTGWRAYDVFTNLVAFMSDGEVEFDSQIFGLGGEFEGLSFITGQELSFPTTGAAIKTSFAKFFDEVKKKINVTIYIDYTGATPILRIESYNDLFINTIVKRLENIENVRYNIDDTKLISIISVGSDKITDVAVGGGVSFVESNLYQTFKTENYTTLGQCNRDLRLDLVSSFVISSNTIEDCLLNGNGVNFSTDIFFIDCDTVVDTGTGYTSSAILGNPFAAAPPYFYNIRLFNSEVLKRWNRLIPNSIVDFSGTVNNLFRASQTALVNVAVPTSFTPFQFNDDFNFPNFDGNGIINNYGNGTAQGTTVSAANSRYTCPENSNYVFFVQMYVFMAAPSNSPIVLSFVRKNSGGTTLQTDSALFNVTQGQFMTMQHQVTYTCDTNDYVEVHVIFQAPGVQVLGQISQNPTYFICTQAPNSGGQVLFLNNEGQIPLIKGAFEYPVLNSDFYDILTNPFGKIAFTYGDKVKAGWIDTFQYNHITSDSKITLLGSKEFLT